MDGRIEPPVEPVRLALSTGDRNLAYAFFIFTFVCNTLYKYFNNTITFLIYTPWKNKLFKLYN